MSTEILKELMRQSEALTHEEKMRLATHLADLAEEGQANEPNSAAATSDAERRREQKWLSEHAEEYAGQWVALDGDHLLSHGTDGRVVLSDACRAGISVPFVVRVEPLDDLPFAGW